ncbi:MAG: peptidase S41 [Desulfuromonas sp.]|nr:MAG: peptidase S41 [Desulfuromonas sp.]
MKGWLKRVFCLLLLGVSLMLIGMQLLPRTVGAASRYEELQLFTEVLALVRKSYVEEVPMKDLVYGAIDGMLTSLDPHSSFMPPEVYNELMVDTSGEFGGIGIEITLKEGLITIVAPIEDTPAARAGLLAGDQIVKIDDELTKEMSLMDAVKLMRGAKGEQVTLGIFREGFSHPEAFTLVREIIKVHSVKSRLLEPGYGYTRITQFQERTATDLAEALDQLRGTSPEGLDGLVLDLRSNPGGLLDQAIGVSDLFLAHGMIVYTEGREEGSQSKFTAHQRGTEPAYPIVVLIDGGSASASEIVAGALQDHGRAVVMGSQSFGKGSVQTIIPLSDDSGLRLTTARYFTPNGTSIQARGITPDIVVGQVKLKEVKEPRILREKDLKNHIETPAAAGPDTDTVESEPVPEVKVDYVLQRALDLLKGWKILKGNVAAAS